MNRVGIRREDKNLWERRTPIIPEHIKELKEKDIEFFVQPSKIRAFKDEEYAEAGAVVQDDFRACSVIFAVKEIPIDFLRKIKHMPFFHTQQKDKSITCQC